MFKRHWYLLLAVPLVTMAIGYFLAAVVTFLMPKIFESVAIVEFTGLSNPKDFTKETRKLTDPDHLTLTSDFLALPDLWDLDSTAVIEILRKSILVDQIAGSRLIRIRARHANREDARDIAVSIINAYRSIHEGHDPRSIGATLHDLEMAVIDQEKDLVKMQIELIVISGKDNPEDTTELEARIMRESDRLMDMKRKILESAHPYLQLAESQGGVVIHEFPLIADAPYSPNITSNLIIGAISGILLGFPLALAIMALLHRPRTSSP